MYYCIYIRVPRSPWRPSNLHRQWGCRENSTLAAGMPRRKDLHGTRHGRDAMAPGRWWSTWWWVGQVGERMWSRRRWSTGVGGEEAAVDVEGTPARWAAVAEMLSGIWDCLQEVGEGWVDLYWTLTQQRVQLAGTESQSLQRWMKVEFRELHILH